MRISNSMRWLVVVAGAIMLLSVAAACAGETVEVPGETVVVEKVVTETVEVPGETVVKEVVKEVQVPGETVVVEKEVVKTVEVPGETVVVKEEVVKTVEVPGETVTVEVVKEVMVPGETVVVEKEVVKTVEVPGETVVVEKEVVKTVEVPGETVVVEKEVVKTVEVPGPERVVVKEVRVGYVTDPSTGKAVSAPQYGGTLTFVMKVEPPNTDPAFGAGSSRGADGVAEKLGIMNWGIDRDEWPFTGFSFPFSVYKGHLAESWEMPDDTTIVFHIRQGVHWHDKPPMNSREFDAYDVEYNYHRYLGLGSGFTERPAGYAGSLKGMTIFESVEATDKWTVVVKLKQPQVGGSVTQTTIGDWPVFMMPPEVIKEHGDVKDWRNLVGTGPYMLTDWVDGSSMTWEKNPDYWGFDEKYPENRLSYIDSLRGLIMTEDATILATLRTGRSDYVGLAGAAESLYIKDRESLSRTNSEIEFYPWAYRSESAFGFNMGGGEERPPFNDVRVRQAMQTALDLETINNTFFKGFAKWKPRGMIGDAVKGYNTPFEEWPEEVKKTYMYDPEGAEALLDEAGYPRGPDGTRFKVALGHYEFFILDYTQLAAAYWADIGVDVDITVRDRSAHLAAEREHTYGDMVTSIAGNDPYGPLLPLEWFYSGGYRNPSNLNDPEYDLLYEAARDATTVEEQQKAVKETDMWLIKNHLYVWGPIDPRFIAIQPWLIGYNGELMLGQDDRKALFARLWIDSELKEAMGR